MHNSIYTLFIQLCNAIESEQRSLLEDKTLDCMDRVAGILEREKILVALNKISAQYDKQDIQESTQRASNNPSY
jgi:hypothetical protein